MNDIILNQFVNDIRQLILNAQQNAVRAIDKERVILYWKIGERLFIEEQNGKERADYGTYLTNRLSAELSQEFGTGCSVRQLEFCRQFYRIFPIANTLRSQLNWSQYRLLIQMDSDDKRTFYIEESCKNNWSFRQLERQVNSQLYERLLISSDKEKVLAIAKGEL